MVDDEWRPADSAPSDGPAKRAEVLPVAKRFGVWGASIPFALFFALVAGGLATIAEGSDAHPRYLSDFVLPLVFAVPAIPCLLCSLVISLLAGKTRTG